MKPTNKPFKTVALLSLSLLATHAVSAEWTLLEDFEDGSFPDGTVVTNSQELFNGEHRITADLLDPTNSVDRIVADVSSGIRNQGNFLDFSFPLETPIEDGSVVTFYHRILVEGPVDENDADGPFGFFDVSYGFVDVDFDGSWAYGDYEAQFGYSTLTNLNWTIRNADETGQLAPWSPIWQNVNPLTDLNVWYEMWLVIDHDSDTSDVYIKGGQFTEQTKVVENAKFRNGGSTDPFKYFVMKSHNGNEDTAAGYRGIDPWYLDDLYIDYTGENLSTPSGGPVTGWTDDAIIGSKYVLGNGWTYSPDLGFLYELSENFRYNIYHGWLYLEPGTFAAGWVYSVDYGWAYLFPLEGGLFSANGQSYSFLQPAG